MVSLEQDLVFDTFTQDLQWGQLKGQDSFADIGDIFGIARTPTPLVSRLCPHQDEHADRRAQKLNKSSPGTPAVISVSTAFYPGAHGVDADLIFCSSDSVLFYVHSPVLLAASEHAFRPILSGSLSDPQCRTSIVHVPETSIVLNIIVHALYSISSVQHSPPFTALITAVDQMPRYEINPKRCIIPSNPLHGQLLSCAPGHPLEIYALAARYDIYDVAARASSHLLSYPLGTISDEMAMRIGAVYLKRLLCLHVNRANALKNIILVAPLPHLPTSLCDFDGQQSLTRAWATVASRLAVDARPGLWWFNA